MRIIINNIKRNNIINSKNNRDTTISYLIFNKNLTIHGFNECYYECVYNNLINVNNYNELYNKDYNKNRPNIYISLKNLITEKYNISIIEFEDLVKLVFRDWTTGNEMLSIENITIKDSECISCFENYQTNYIINNIAINEFKDFIKIRSVVYGIKFSRWERYFSFCSCSWIYI